MMEETLNKCKKLNSDPIITLREKKSIYKGLNSFKKSICVYKVDGCVYKEGTADTRCDYLLATENNLFFIELKGIDIKKGLNQLLISVKNLKTFFLQNHIKTRIVSSARGMKPNRLSTIKEYRKLSKLIGAENILIKKSPFEETLNK